MHSHSKASGGRRSWEGTTKPRAPGKWSPKQVIGHLIDSASNNHQRFVRGQQGAELLTPTYAQDHWVDCQGYVERPWRDLTGLWHAYNRHLAHVIERIPADRARIRCTVGGNQPVTLAFLAEVEAGKLTVRQISESGKDLDRFTITK